MITNENVYSRIGKIIDEATVDMFKSYPNDEARGMIYAIEKLTLWREENYSLLSKEQHEMITSKITEMVTRV